MTLKNAKILHVEDEDVQAFLIKTMLNIADCEMYYRANSYQSAFAAIGECKPDIILMDVNIVGDKTGIDIARDLHKAYYIPVIFITNTGIEEQMEMIRALPMCKLLSKTVRYDKLISEISDSLEKSKKSTVFDFYKSGFADREEVMASSLLNNNNDKTMMFKSWFKSIL